MKAAYINVNILVSDSLREIIDDPLNSLINVSLTVTRHNIINLTTKE